MSDESKKDVNQPFKVLGDLIPKTQGLDEIVDPFQEVEVDSDISSISFGELPISVLEHLDQGDELGKTFSQNIAKAFKTTEERDKFITELYYSNDGAKAAIDSALKDGKRVHKLQTDNYSIGALALKNESKLSSWRDDLGKIHIPLLHSGFYIRIKKPGMQDYINLRKIIALEEIAIARTTGGISTLLSNSVANGHVRDYIKKNLILTDLEKGTTKDQAMDLIKDEDLKTIMIFILNSFYPNGHPFQLPCNSRFFEIKKDDETECHNVRSGIVNFRSLWTFNQDMFTEDQLKFMDIRNTNRKLVDVEKYQEEMATRSNSFTLGNVTFNFKFATITDKEVAMKQWIKDIINSIDSAVIAKMSVESRESMIMQSMSVAHLRNYLPYIKSIDIVKDDEVDTIITDDITKVGDEVIELLCDISDSESREDFVNAINKFISDNSVVDIGFTNKKCPECGTHYGNDPHTYLIPVDVQMLFFGVLDTRELWLRTRSIR